jgi:hypothetical protein
MEEAQEAQQVLEHLDPQDLDSQEVVVPLREELIIVSVE